MRSQGVNRIDTSPSRSRHDNCMFSQVDKQIKYQQSGYKDQTVKQAEKQAPPKLKKENILVKYPENKYYVERGISRNVLEFQKVSRPCSY